MVRDSERCLHKNLDCFYSRVKLIKFENGIIFVIDVTVVLRHEREENDEWHTFRILTILLRYSYEGALQSRRVKEFIKKLRQNIPRVTGREAMQ